MTTTPTPPRSALYPADNPAVTAHISMLQGIISRLANNSSSCKTWCLTLVGAALSLAGATRTPAIASFVLVPIVIFGFIDTMYLAQEKAFRDLYDRIITAIRGATYSLDNAFDAKAPRNLDHVGWALTSWSIWPIYGGLILAYIAALCFGWIELLAKPAGT
jgi:hypothetical protein